MALKTTRLPLGPSSMPYPCETLGVTLERESVTKIKGGTSNMVLIRPSRKLLPESEAIGPEPRWHHVLCGLNLRLGDGTVEEGSGQLLITGRRVIGIIDEVLVPRSSGELSTPETAFCFTFLRDDVYPAEKKKNRFPKPSDFTFRSREEQPISFRLIVFSALGSVSSNQLHLWHDKNMIHALSDERRPYLLGA